MLVTTRWPVVHIKCGGPRCLIINDNEPIITMTVILNEEEQNDHYADVYELDGLVSNLDYIDDIKLQIMGIG